MAQPYVLLVEDDKFISRAYKDGLEQSGFEVATAADGVLAMESIKTRVPQLILLDLIMPEKDGFEVLAELKMNKELKHIPVIILTNLGQASDIQKAKDLGAVDYLVKADSSMQQVIEKVKIYVAQNTE
jgi:DNA-binding response OmpR family regulator